MLRACLILFAAVALTGCDQEPKEVSVVQQFSDMQSEWQDMALVYGFAFDNVELADVTRDAFAIAYPERQYRVVTRQMPRWKYERLTKQVEAP